MLTGSFNAPVYAWEIATGQMVRKLEPGTYMFSPDNRMLARSRENLRIFDLYDGRFLREYKGDGNGFGNFVFSPNSKFLAASCFDTTILVWPAGPAGAETGKPWDEKDLARVLEIGSAAEAYPAIGLMIADPERTLPFLERRLKPMPGGKTGKGKGVDEKPQAISAEDIFHLRAIQALERIGTKRARKLLENLARGAEASPRTRAAVEALGRMKGRRRDEGSP